MRPAILLIALTILFGACTRFSGTDARLERAAALASESPREALAILDSIRPDSLSKADRHLYDFLTVKASDKAYITPGSDSLILSVIAYAADHSRVIPYGEALYYGGRVYSELGDYPTALSYFHQALEEYPPSTPDQLQRATILSQSGQLLKNLRLYDESLPYVREAIKIDSIIGDSLKLMYNHQLAGAIEIRREKYNNALQHLGQALEFARYSGNYQATNNYYLSRIAYLTNNYKEALRLIQSTLLSIDSLGIESARTLAIAIYRENGLSDSAAIMAQEIIHSSSLPHRIVGFRMAFSEPLRPFIPVDSVESYLNRYQDDLETVRAQNNDEATIIQNAFYNYKKHRIDKEQAEEKSHKYLMAVYLISLVCLLLIGIVFILKYRSAKNMLRLQATISKLQAIKNALPQQPENHVPPTDTLSLRDKLIKEIESLATSDPAALDKRVVDSDPYRHISLALDSGDLIPDSSPLWRSFDSEISQAYPRFFERINILSVQPLTREERNIVLLIKAGISSADMARIVGRGKSTINYRRSNISNKLFGEKIPNKTLDRLIRSL
ncbi:MAG: hypothetical protein K2K55_08540 [Duncaniella sp.]|nr:hypothetical protein [Duncaniella sp.]